MVYLQIALCYSVHIYHSFSHSFSLATNLFICFTFSQISQYFFLCIGRTLIFFTFLLVPQLKIFSFFHYMYRREIREGVLKFKEKDNLCHIKLDTGLWTWVTINQKHQFLTKRHPQSTAKYVVYQQHMKNSEPVSNSYV